MNRSEENILALMVIKKGGSFSNSYWLCKFLSRMFDVFNCDEIIKNLIEYKYVTYVVSDGVEIFQLSEKGMDIMDRNYERILNILFEKFPEQNDIIKLMEKNN